MQGIDGVASVISPDLPRFPSVDTAGAPSGVNGIHPDDAAMFSSMMQSNEMTSVARLTPAARITAPSTIERLATIQGAEMRDVFQSTREVMLAAPHMSTAEMVGAGNEISLRVAMTTMQFSAAASFGKSASTGVQTLMKNQ